MKFTHPSIRGLEHHQIQCLIHTYICQSAYLERRPALSSQALQLANCEPLQLRRGASANGESSDEAVEELEELREEVDEQHDTSSIVTSMVSPAPSVSRLSRCFLMCQLMLSLAPFSAGNHVPTFPVELAVCRCLDPASYAGRPVAAG